MNAPRQTIKDRLHDFLTQHGLWPKEADMILNPDLLKKNGVSEPLIEVLDKDADGYPTHFFAIANLTIRHEALNWIDANKPMHFAQYALDPNRMKGEQS